MTVTVAQGICLGCTLSRLLCIIETEVLVIFIDEKICLKGYRSETIKLKIVNFARDTTNFLGGFSCLSKIELMIKLCQKASSSKVNFLKASVGAYKNRIKSNQDK